MWTSKLVLFLLGLLVAVASANEYLRRDNGELEEQSIKAINKAAAKAQILNMDLLRVSEQMQNELNKLEHFKIPPHKVMSLRSGKSSATKITTKKTTTKASKTNGTKRTTEPIINLLGGGKTTTKKATSKSATQKTTNPSKTSKGSMKGATKGKSIKTTTIASTSTIPEKVSAAPTTTINAVSTEALLTTTAVANESKTEAKTLASTTTAAA